MNEDVCAAVAAANIATATHSVDDAVMTLYPLFISAGWIATAVTEMMVQ